MSSSNAACGLASRMDKPTAGLAFLQHPWDCHWAGCVPSWVLPAGSWAGRAAGSRAAFPGTAGEAWRTGSTYVREEILRIPGRSYSPSTHTSPYPEGSSGRKRGLLAPSYTRLGEKLVKSWWYPRAKVCFCSVPAASPRRGRLPSPPPPQRRRNKSLRRVFDVPFKCSSGVPQHRAWWGNDWTYFSYQSWLPIQASLTNLSN